MPANIDVKEVEVLYIDELPVQAASLDTMIKPRLDRITEQMNSIK